MGVENEYDAFVATKQAVYSILYGYDAGTRFRGGDSRGTAIANAIVNLVNIGRNGTQTPYTAGISTQKVGDFKEDDNYYSQEYKINCGVNTKEYSITSTVGLPNGAIITDLNNNAKTTFSGSENFKIEIPKSEMRADINVAFSIQAKAETYPVFYGKTTVAGTQDYALAFDPYGDITGKGTLNLKTNTGSIQINKTDKETSEPISGVTFQLTKEDGTIVANATTDEKGIATFSGLYQDNYKLKEIATDKNYVINNATFDVNVEYNKTTKKDITNEHKEGSLKIYKVDKDNHRITLGNVKFDLFSEEFQKVIGTYTTDVNGEIKIDNLRIGEYKLIEKSTGKWYNLAEDTNVEVKWNTTSENTIENELKKGQIKVIKVDLDNKEIKLKGVKFDILDENGKVLETITTNENGEAYTSRYAIRDFAKLTIREKETLQNYVLNETPQTIILEENQIKTITFTNELKKGQVKVIKVDLDNNEVKLKGVEFNVIDEDNNIVDKLITNENGEATSKKLRIDKTYTVQETKTLQNYVLNDTPKTVILKQDQITNVKFTNEKKKGQIKVIKVDKDDNTVLLDGVKFEILDSKGNVVDKIITDTKGEAVTKRLPIDDTYTARETETLENYVLSEETQTIKLEENQIKNMTFENEKIKGYIQISKYSSDNNKYSELKEGAKLEGATFEIYDSENNLVNTITTDKEGKAVSKELLKGNYTLKEIVAPDYYIINENTFNAEIINHKEIVNVDIKNENVDIDVEITKKGFIETQCEDTIYYDFKDIKNNSNVPLDNFTWQDTLPTEAVRLEKIYTGTWNEDLKYSVWYKTNTSEEYKIFNENLSTSTNNELDFTTLDLADDEYVTDFEFRFGTVKVGYQEVETPVVYCKVLNGLENGYTFTNTTKVSGSYLEKYVEDNDEWTSVVYKKNIDFRPKL